MGLKTEKTQKLRAKKRYYTEFGKIKYFNIFKDLFLIVVLIPVFFLMLELLFFVRQFGSDFVNYLNFNNLFTVAKNIFSNFGSLKNDGILEAITYYYIIFASAFFIFYLFYLALQIKKANVLAKLSSLGLENYKLKKKKSGLLFLVKRGEELDKSKFQDEKLENIKQIFSNVFKENDEIVVERYNEKGKKGFYLKKVNLELPKFNTKFLKKGKIFFGKGLKEGDIYIPINELTHYFITGESGAGKSVFQNVLINQFIYNLKDGGIDLIYLVDLKGGVEFLQYNKFKNVKVVTDIKQLLILTQELIVLMEKRNNEMIKKEIKNWKEGQIICLIDEFASVQDQSLLLEKNEAKELINNLRTLAAKARAFGIKILVATQKGTSDNIDTTVRNNLQSRVLMRTIAKEAQEAVVPKDQIKELGVNPAKFAKGRFIFFSEKILDLVQSPFVAENFYKEIMKIRQDLVKTDNSFKELEVKNDESCCEVEADIFSKNEDGEERGDEFLHKNKDETSNNLSPKNKEEFLKEVEEIKQIGDEMVRLNRAINLRKKIFKEVGDLKDENLRRQLFKELREIKKRQEEKNELCLDELVEIQLLLP